MIISINAEKAFDKIQHSFLIKALQTAGIEGIYFNMIKAIYDKPTSNILCNGLKIESISPKVRNNTRVPTLTTTIQHSFGSFSHSNREEKQIKGTQIGSEVYILMIKKLTEKVKYIHIHNIYNVTYYTLSTFMINGYIYH